MAFFYFGAPFAGIARVLNPSLSGLPHYEKTFWLDAWFWSDAIVNVGWGAFVFWALWKLGRKEMRGKGDGGASVMHTGI